MELTINEFFECIADYKINFDDDIILKDCINKFLSMLSKQNRIIFMQRYWYCCSIEEIAKNVSLSKNNIKVSLHRLRIKFRNFLKKEGML